MGHRTGRNRPAETPATHPHLFRSVRDFGSLPAPPASFSYFAESLAAQSDILGNDSLGDCTAAGACHIVEAVTGAAGDPVVLSASEAVAFYSLSAGYVPGDPATDQGGDEVTVCTTWRDKGLDGKGAHAIVGWLAIDPTDAALVKACAWLFEALYFGLELDASWSASVNTDGFVWADGTPDPNEGHCIVGGGADEEGILVNSWGFIGKITYACIAKFCAASAGGNLFAILTPDILDRAKAKAPTGFDWAGVEAHFTAIGGVLPAKHESLLERVEDELRAIV